MPPSTRLPTPLRSTVTLMAAAFGAYFCMYAFRKPVTVGEFTGMAPGEGGIEMKTALLVGQLVGYSLSKFAGIYVCSAVPRRWLGPTLAGLILVGEGALVAFAVVPPGGRVAALFVNGLPLGMVWGLVVRYLEGRRLSDVLLAGLSASFVISTGVVKDVGRWLLVLGVEEVWMPAATGALFLVPFLLCVTVLAGAPAPDAGDERERMPRRAMTRQERRAFLLRFGGALVPLVVMYSAFTAHRDFRDNYGVEIFRELGYLDLPALFTRTDLPGGIVALVGLALLNAIRSHGRALAAAYAMMGAGCMTLLAATALHQAGFLDGLQWMILVGMGAYLAYVPVASVFFERLVAAGGSAGTAVFGIYLADALGYTGSVGVQLLRDLTWGGSSRLAFFEGLTWGIGGVGVLLVLGSALLLFRVLGRTASPFRSTS